MKDHTDNPIEPANLANSPRCGAKTRSGGECRSPAVRGRRRCRLHGGTSPGAPKGNRNAWKHGNRSAEAEQQLKILRAADRDLQILSKVRQGLELRRKELDRLIQLQIEERALRSRTRGMLPK
jgi:glucans biosynthesis protein